MLDLIVAVLCAYRLTQLIVWDGILSRLTNWLAGRSAWFAGLVNCAHCAGVWCSAFTAGLLYLVHIGWWPIRYVLYALGIAGAVSIFEHYTEWLSPKRPVPPVYEKYFYKGGGMAKETRDYFKLTDAPPMDAFETEYMEGD